MDSRLLQAIVIALTVWRSCATHCSEIVITDNDMLGPFYIKNMPYRPDGFFAEDVNDTLLIVDGFVADRNCHHITCASVHVWAADNFGDYQFDWPWNLRARVVPDRQGYYRYETALPGYYGGRPRHVHIGVELQGNWFFVTQLYFSDDPEAVGQQSGDVRQKTVVQSHGGRVVWETEFPLILNVDVADLHEECRFQADPLQKAVRIIASLRSDATVADEQSFLLELKGELLTALRLNATVSTLRLETRFESADRVRVVVDFFPTIAPQAESSPLQLSEIVVGWYSSAVGSTVWSAEALSLFNLSSIPSVEEVEVVLCEFGHWASRESSVAPPWPSPVPTNVSALTTLADRFPSSLDYTCPLYANYIFPVFVDPFPPVGDDDIDDSDGSTSTNDAPNDDDDAGLLWSALVFLMVSFKAIVV